MKTSAVASSNLTTRKKRIDVKRLETYDNIEITLVETA